MGKDSGAGQTQTVSGVRRVTTSEIAGKRLQSSNTQLILDGRGAESERLKLSPLTPDPVIERRASFLKYARAQSPAGALKTQSRSNGLAFLQLCNIVRNILHSWRIRMASEERFRTELAFDPAFTAKMALDFALLVSKQAEIVYESKGITFPVTVSSTVLYLARVKAASLVEIARALGHPHQLISLRLKTLLKLELIVSDPDFEDRRRVVYSLTEKGKSQSARLQKYCGEAAEVFRDLSDEVGVDLLAGLRAAFDSMQSTPLSSRFESLAKRKGA
ncbi:MAG: hypothetical protein V7741_01535 [Hyphomonas sp.]